VLAQLPELQSLGVDVLRISPQSEHTARIIEIFAVALNGATLAPLEAELNDLLPLGPCNGYLMQQAGMHHGSAHVA
jgi:collagenase-like PrtC family protease